MATMKGVTYHGPRDVRVEEVERPQVLEPGDVLLKVRSTSICGSDLHPYHGRLELEEGVVMGHEYLGTVVEAGSGVREIDEGDRAIGSFHVCCGKCWFCRRGQQAKCVLTSVFGMGMLLGDLSGAQAEYMRVPEADLTLRRVPEGMGEESALFVGDILTTGYEAVRKAGMRPGDVVAVIGAGPVGLCTIMSAIALGAGRVVAVDMVEDRLELAGQLGALPVNASETDPVDVVLGLTDWRGADLVVDAVGHESALRATAPLVRMGGSVSIPGIYYEPELTVPIGDLWLKNTTIHMGVANIHAHMDEVLMLVAEGKLDPAVMISHRMGLSEAVEAYSLFDSKQALKVVLDPAA